MFHVFFAVGPLQRNLAPAGQRQVLLEWLACRCATKIGASLLASMATLTWRVRRPEMRISCEGKTPIFVYQKGFQNGIYFFLQKAVYRWGLQSSKQQPGLEPLSPFSPSFCLPTWLCPPHVLSGLCHGRLILSRGSFWRVCSMCPLDLAAFQCKRGKNISELCGTKNAVFGVESFTFEWIWWFSRWCSQRMISYILKKSPDVGCKIPKMEQLSLGACSEAEATWVWPLSVSFNMFPCKLCFLCIISHLNAQQYQKTKATLTKPLGTSSFQRLELPLGEMDAVYCLEHCNKWSCNSMQKRCIQSEARKNIEVKSSWEEVIETFWGLEWMRTPHNLGDLFIRQGIHAGADGFSWRIHRVSLRSIQELDATEIAMALSKC